jgi:hypothetical protein
MDENGGLMFDFIKTTWGYARIPKGTIHRFWAQEGQFSTIGNIEGRALPGTNFLPFWQTQRIAIAGFNFRIYYRKYQSIGLFDFHGPNKSPLDELVAAIF